MKSGLVLTIVLGAILMGLVIVGLATGLILTGKSRLRRGCGLTPGKKRGDTSCGVCGKKQVCDPEEEDEPSNNRKAD